jgi:hypothetical protein
MISFLPVSHPTGQYTNLAGKEKLLSKPRGSSKKWQIFMYAAYQRSDYERKGERQVEQFSGRELNGRTTGNQASAQRIKSEYVLRAAPPY